MTERTSDEAAMAAYAANLVDAVDAALGPWIRAAVTSRYPGAVPQEVENDIELAGIDARSVIGNDLRRLLALDIDEQWTNPLSVIRAAAMYPTTILANAGAAVVQRDETARRLHPDDLYDLVPSSFGDLGPAVHEPGLVWGAAKAHLHLRRRKQKETA